MADTDLPTLVARAQKGDRAAFESIVHCTARLVYAQIVASVRDRHQAEDLSQETFLAAWKHIADLRSHDRAGAITWLLTLARNKVLDALKFDARKKRGGIGPGDTTAAAQISPVVPKVVPTPSSASHVSNHPHAAPAPSSASHVSNHPHAAPAPASHDPADLPDRAPSPDQAALRHEAQDHALRLLEELPDEYRQPLAMRYLAGADYHAIRAALDLSDGALRGLLNRGMALLRERMSRQNEDKVTR